jgi:hypothetical protein
MKEYTNKVKHEAFLKFMIGTLKQLGDPYIYRIIHGLVKKWKERIALNLYIFMRYHYGYLSIYYYIQIS